MSEDEARLSRIATQWSIVHDMHGIQPDSVRAAQEALLTRYGGAVHRYLCGALRDADAADEVFQEFALRFVRGDFQRASPDLGRFRDYLKTVVFRLIIDYQRRRGRAARIAPLADGDPPDLNERANAAEDDEFTRNWREQLLTRAWSALQQEEQSSGKPYYTVLRVRVDRPEAHSPELAEQLAEQLGKPISAGNLRVLLHRARESFARLLLEEVMHSLRNPSRDALERELIDLDLHRYCRDALHDWT